MYPPPRARFRPSLYTVLCAQPHRALQTRVERFNREINMKCLVYIKALSDELERQVAPRSPSSSSLLVAAAVHAGRAEQSARGHGPRDAH